MRQGIIGCLSLWVLIVCCAGGLDFAFCLVMPVVFTVWWCLQSFRCQLHSGYVFVRGCMNGMHQGIPVGSSSRSCHLRASNCRKVGPRRGLVSLRTLAFLCLVSPVRCLECIRVRGAKHSVWDPGLSSTELGFVRVRGPQLL